MKINDMKDYCKKVNIDKVNVSFFAPDSNIPITQEEIEKRKRRVARAEAIGSSITRVTTELEHENPIEHKH